MRSKAQPEIASAHPLAEARSRRGPEAPVAGASHSRPMLLGGRGLYGYDP